MTTPHDSTPTRTVHNIALAYFSNREHVSDAIRDLCAAGFSGGQINISGQPDDHAMPRPHQPVQNAIGAHTLLWRLSQAHDHDRHRRGVTQSSGLDAPPTEATNPTCWTLDLPAALHALDVPARLIQLLQHDTLHQGMFLLIDAPDRVEEASAILSDNAGFLRTRYLLSMQA